MTNSKEKLRDNGHNFDGIQEYDNDMPRWWIVMFYLTIVFAAGYMAYYHTFLSSPTLQDEYGNSVAEAKASEGKTTEPSGGSSDAGKPAVFEYKDHLNDAAMIAAGKATFVSNCAACHTADGGGLVGPNLTDDFWIHGAKFSAVETAISKGILDKGMPAWEGPLGAQKIRELVVFIASIQGTTPATPKAPQGDPGKLGKD